MGQLGWKGGISRNILAVGTDAYWTWLLSELAFLFVCESCQFRCNSWHAFLLVESSPKTQNILTLSSFIYPSELFTCMHTLLSYNLAIEDMSRWRCNNLNKYNKATLSCWQRLKHTTVPISFFLLVCCLWFIRGGMHSIYHRIHSVFWSSAPLVKHIIRFMAIWISH